MNQTLPYTPCELRNIFMRVPFMIEMCETYSGTVESQVSVAFRPSHSCTVTAHHCPDCHSVNT